MLSRPSTLTTQTTKSQARGKANITPFSLETPKEATPNELPSMPLAKSYPRHTPVTVPCYKLQCSLKSLYMRNIYA